MSMFRKKDKSPKPGKGKDENPLCKKVIERGPRKSKIPELFQYIPRKIFEKYWEEAEKMTEWLIGAFKSYKNLDESQIFS